MSIFEWLWEHARPIGETLKVWAQIIAYGSGGLFLIYKVVSGYFICDLSLKVSCERFSNGEKDQLAVTAAIKKGENGAVQVHDARIRVTDQSGAFVDARPMIGTERLSFNTDGHGRMMIEFDRTSSESPFLNLPPGDETQLCGLCTISPALPYIIEVVILGRKVWVGKTAQWRASAVSFPKHT